MSDKVTVFPIGPMNTLTEEDKKIEQLAQLLVLLGHQADGVDHAATGVAMYAEKCGGSLSRQAVKELVEALRTLSADMRSGEILNRSTK
jgi:hypothetical protein